MLKHRNPPKKLIRSGRSLRCGAIGRRVLWGLQRAVGIRGVLGEDAHPKANTIITEDGVLQGRLLSVEYELSEVSKATVGMAALKHRAPPKKLTRGEGGRGRDEGGAKAPCTSKKSWLGVGDAGRGLPPKDKPKRRGEETRAAL